jgi:hypothetical protein
MLGTWSTMGSGTQDQDTTLAASRVLARLGTEGTERLIALLDCPKVHRAYAVAEEETQGMDGAAIAEIARRLYRDDPMRRRFVRALRQALRGT